MKPVAGQNAVCAKQWPALWMSGKNIQCPFRCWTKSSSWHAAWFASNTRCVLINLQKRRISDVWWLQPSPWEKIRRSGRSFYSWWQDPPSCHKLWQDSHLWNWSCLGSQARYITFWRERALLHLPDLRAEAESLAWKGQVVCGSLLCHIRR